MVSDNIILTRVFTELRFPVRLLYSDLKLLNTFVNYLSNIYENASYDNNTAQISCNSLWDKKNAYFWNNRIVVDMDNPVYEDFKENTEEVLSKYYEIFEVPQFDRVGVRFYWVLPYEDIETAKIVFYTNFFPFLNVDSDHYNTDSIKKGKSEMHIDVGNDKFLNIAISPAKLHTVDFLMNGSDTRHVSESVEGLMIDSDLYKQGKIDKEDYLNLLSVANKETKSKALELCKIIGAK